MTPVGFFIVGAAKCGTSSVAAALAKNKNIDFCVMKEPRIFSPSLVGRIGPGSREFNRTHVKSMEEYQKLFTGDGLKGEASVDYLWCPESAELIFNHNPDAKIIIILRDPVQRLQSEYRHLLRDGYLRPEKKEFCFTAEASLVKNNYIPLFFHGQRSLYQNSLKRFLEFFPAEQILVLDYQYLLSSWQESVWQVLHFLRVPKEGPVDIEFENKGLTPKSPLAARVINSDFLRQILKPIVPLSFGKAIKKKLTELNKSKITDEKIELYISAKDRLQFEKDYDETIKLLNSRRIKFISRSLDYNYD